MKRSHTPRWRPVLVIAATLLLSTGAAASAAASEPPAADGQVPTTVVSVDDPAAVEPAPEASPAVDPTAPEPAAPDEAVPTEVPSVAPPPAEVPAADPAPAADEPGAGSRPQGTVVDPGPATDRPIDEGAMVAAHGDGPTITVNGQPFEGQGDPKLEGCTIQLAVAGLAEGSHSIAGAIRAGEEGKVTLVEFDDAFDGGTWSHAWPLDDLVGELEQKPNGYRVSISLAIDDGATLDSRPFWLACGAAQDGNPFVVVLDKQWQDVDGTPLAGPPANLPEDWSLTASSKLGTATCTYPAGSDELVCDYDNKGSHEGATEGLYVPGGEKHTYTVAESTLPDGWSIISGVGTFAPRAVCPRGDDEHEANAIEASEPRPPCAHIVIDRRNPLPTTTTTVASTTTAATTTSDAPGSDVEGTGVDEGTTSGTIVRTGSSPAPLALIGLVLVVGGVVVLAARRRLLRNVA
ncbi:MAG: hypothetical protein U0P45_12545 [Acidimicrobiales bacterium]